MTKEELEKDYYADRPTEPYSDDNSPNDWANIAHYAEENLEKTFERIAELEKENASLKAYNEKLLTSEMNMQNELCNTIIKCKRLEKENIEAKEIITELYHIIPASMSDYAREPMERAKRFMEDEKMTKAEHKKLIEILEKNILKLQKDLKT